MRLNIKNVFLIAIIHYSLFAIPALAVEIPKSLKDAINEKSNALQEINQKILETQKDLEETSGKGKTLQNQIKKTDQQINQLNLNIRSSEINIEKLNLEVRSLGYNIDDVQSKIETKKSGLAQILKEIQRTEKENILVTFLKGKSLAEGLRELENLGNLNSGLSNEVSGLNELKSELSGKLDQTSQKKNKIESENKNLKNKKVIAANEKSDRQTLLQQTKNQEKTYQNQLSDLKKLQLEVSLEVEKIEAELRKNIDPSLLPIPRPGVLQWPVSLTTGGGIGKLTQKWGISSPLYNGRAHNGIDVGAPIGTPIAAAEKGKVLEVWNQDKYCYKGAYGKFVVIEHENNLTTLYAHLSLQSVQKGETVERGQLIGYVGSTGYATGPHLHLTVYASQTFTLRPSKVNCGPIMPFGGDLDPLKYL